MYPFGIRPVSLWDTGFCFCLHRVVEQYAVPSLKVARRRDVSPFGVERLTFGDPPVRRDSLAIDAQAWAGRHGNEAVMFKFTEPPLHRSGRFRAKIIGGLAIGAENLPVVRAVYS